MKFPVSLARYVIKMMINYIRFFAMIIIILCYTIGYKTCRALLSAISLGLTEHKCIGVCKSQFTCIFPIQRCSKAATPERRIDDDLFDAIFIHVTRRLKRAET